MKRDYTQFDEVLLQQISAGKNTAILLENRHVITWTEQFCGNIHGPRRHVYRVTDGRLQSLRKRGLIRFDGKVWHVCKP